MTIEHLLDNCANIDGVGIEIVYNGLVYYDGDYNNIPQRYLEMELVAYDILLDDDCCCPCIHIETVKEPKETPEETLNRLLYKYGVKHIVSVLEENL